MRPGYVDETCWWSLFAYLFGYMCSGLLDGHGYQSHPASIKIKRCISKQQLQQTIGLCSLYVIISFLGNTNMHLGLTSDERNKPHAPWKDLGHSDSFKSASRGTTDNYRVIAVLPIIETIFEVNLIKRWNLADMDALRSLYSKTSFRVKYRAWASFLIYSALGVNQGVSLVVY